MVSGPASLILPMQSYVVKKHSIAISALHAIPDFALYKNHCPFPNPTFFCVLHLWCDPLTCVYGSTRFIANTSLVCAMVMVSSDLNIFTAVWKIAFCPKTIFEEKWERGVKGPNYFICSVFFYSSKTSVGDCTIFYLALNLSITHATVICLYFWSRWLQLVLISSIILQFSSSFSNVVLMQTIWCANPPNRAAPSQRSASFG